jgi:hypothetical protein
MTALRAEVDGVALPEQEARGIWERFSLWMDAHAGDLAGFAKAEGFASVHPELYAGGAVLVLSRTQPQGPYRTAPKKHAPRVGQGQESRHGTPARPRARPRGR